MMLIKERKIEETLMREKDRIEPMILRKERNIKEPMEVNKEGKSRQVRISLLKRLRGDSNAHGFSVIPPTQQYGQD